MMSFKMINKLGIGIVVLLGLFSCDKKLDIDPRASLSPETISANDVQLLLNGIYDGLQNGNTTFYYLSYATEDLSADNLQYRATFFQHGEVDNNAILTNNVLTQRYFNGPYAFIQRANDLIEVLNSAADMPETIKKEALGQAHYLRAYGYYKLVTLFGGVPIALTRSIENAPRNSEEEVYAQIIKDLLIAKDNAPAFSSVSRVSLDAAKALLARVYLIRKDYNAAKQYAQEVIGNPKFALSNNYNAIFDKPYSSSENIFCVTTTPTEAENSLSFFLQHPSMPGSGRAELLATTSLADSYEPNDSRKAASLTQITAPTTLPGWYCKKFRDPAGQAEGAFFISRISEMYLTLAEAQFMISNSSTDALALSNINAVRTIRGVTALSSIDLDAIAKERRVELAFEGLRWTDMKRLPSPSNPSKSMALVYCEAKGRGVNDLLYPLPQAAIDVNDLLIQNPGY